MLKQTRKTIRRTTRALGRSFVALVLTASMTTLPTSAGAEEPANTTGAGNGTIAEAAAQWTAASENASQGNYSPYSYVSDDAAASAANNGIATLSDGEEDAISSPESYDLRTLGVVTPVKSQGLWGTCWAFGILAASETSILSESGKTYEEWPLDLSERALAYFAFTTVPEGSQAGEGAGFSDKTKEENPNAAFNMGGLARFGGTLFSAGVGPILEEDAPYKNDEELFECYVWPNEDDEEFCLTLTLTADQIEEYESKGIGVGRYYYSKTVDEVDLETGELISSKPATWKVSSDLWSKSAFELEESSILPEYRITDDDGKYVSTSEKAIEATKKEIEAGRAVAISYKSDYSYAGEERDSSYTNPESWAHYTYEDAEEDHLVTIVGWDDNYSRENFGVEDSDGNLIEGSQPPADGAWIVKNSWGSELNWQPNYGDWGAVDEEGRHTGYFYLSYYDKSISNPASFNFDMSASATSEEQTRYQYDYLIPEDDPVTLTTSTPSAEANVFTASEKSTVKSVACQTTRPNTEVTYSVYVLDSGAASPTDGTLAATATSTYEYGGYHRLALDESKWVHLKKGQKFSVVVTQYCKDDGKYYQSAVAASKTHDSEVEEDLKAAFTGVVNEGESYTYTPGSGSSGGAWTDWSDIVGWMESADDYTYDNFPIKAYAEIDTTPETEKSDGSGDNNGNNDDGSGDNDSSNAAKDLIYNSNNDGGDNANNNDNSSVADKGTNKAAGKKPVQTSDATLPVAAGCAVLAGVSLVCVLRARRRSGE